MTIEGCLEFKFIIVAPDSLLSDAVALLNQKKQQGFCHCLLVVSEGQLQGIVTKTDIMQSLAEGFDFSQTTLDRVMTQPVITILRSQKQNISSVWFLMQQHNISYLPVLGEDREIIGLITTQSLLKYLQPTAINSHLEAKDDEEQNFNTHKTTELERFFDISPGMLCITNFGGYFKRVNDTFNDTLGFTKQELLAEPFINFVHPEDRASTIAELASLIAGKTTFSFENRYRTKQGDYRWFLWTAKPYLAEKIIYAAARDITDRKQVELQLQRERDFSHAVIDTVGALVAVLDRQGKIVQFNRTCEQITGYSFVEIKEKPIWDFLIPPEEQPAFQAVFEKLLTGQLPNQYANHWVAKNGTRHLISWSNTALFDSQRKVSFLITTGIDITEQNRVWQQLEHQYRQTKLLAEITRKIRMSIEIEEILQTTTTEVQHLLNCDRVLLVEIHSHNTVLPISEAVLRDLPSMLNYELSDPLLTGEYLSKYRQGEILAINDVLTTPLASEIKQLLAQFQIRAKLVVPILSQNQLQGLVVAHQCHNARTWQENEINLLISLTDQIGVALSQAQLLNRLEEMVTERTIELTTTNQLLQAEIAEREQTEIALRENQQKLTGILDHADEAIISIDEQQRIKLFNKGAEKIFGHQAQDMIGRSLELLIPEVFHQIHQQHLQQFKNSTEQSRTMAKRSRNVYGLRQNGQIFPAEASIAKLNTQEGMLFTVMLKDIAEQQQAEEQLRVITDALPVLIAYIDNQERHLYNNRTYETWFSQPRSTLLGLEIAELFSSVDYQKMLPYIKVALSGKAVTFEMQSTKKNGNPCWISATFIPDFDSNNRVKGFFSMIDDITDRKEIERLKSEFVSVASHEMRTPLTSIHGVIKLLSADRLGVLSPQAKQMVAIAARNSDRLMRLLDDILNLERLESNRDPLEFQSCDSVELIEQAIETVSSMAHKQQITLEYDAPSFTLSVDRDRIIQTLTNLLSNAIKFSPPESTVKITCQLQPQQILFQVTDRGRGIPQDKLETIFERFQQVDASDSRKKGGTGLGLAICRHIVEQHGGKIWAESIYGCGSTFFFTIPRE